MGISASEIASARTDARSNMLSSARVLVHSSAPDGGGGSVDSYEPWPGEGEDPLPCSIAPLGQGGSVRTAGGRISEGGTHVVSLPLPSEVAVRSVDRLEVDGISYTVTAVRVRGEMSITERVEVRAL